jgi:hypothetical protein
LYAPKTHPAVYRGATLYNGEFAIFLFHESAKETNCILYWEVITFYITAVCRFLAFLPNMTYPFGATCKMEGGGGQHMTSVFCVLRAPLQAEKRNAALQ